MKSYNLIFYSTLVCVMYMSAIPLSKEDNKLKGAWKSVSGSEKSVIIMQDGYFTLTKYDTVNKKFLNAKGGKYQAGNGLLTVICDFNSDKTEVGNKLNMRFTISGNELSIHDNKDEHTWQLIDNTSTDITGCWRINGRIRDGKMSEMKPAPRKTLKILSGTRFQWMAINTETKEFFGTGGGSYTLKDGVYTEHIEFFSRDSSRVGRNLSFSAKVTDSIWHHSGSSSQGEPIQETWTRY